MFTGIIEELGEVIEVKPTSEGQYIRIKSIKILEDAKIGDSISINGCCLTITAIPTAQEASFHIVEETLKKTNLGHLKTKDRINLERAVKFSDRMGGHLVQGHVDTVGKILEKKSLQDGSWWITFQIDEKFSRYMIHKGSIAVDGVSLTVADLSNNTFSVAIIPHTAHVTTLGFKNIEETVNVEVDLIAKYVENFLNPHRKYPV